MNVVGISVLDEFADKHGDVRDQIASWVNETMAATWQTPADIKARYASASFLAHNRVVFNLKGSKYRLEVVVGYKNQTVLVKRIGTHAEYSRWSDR